MRTFMLVAVPAVAIAASGCGSSAASAPAAVSSRVVMERQLPGGTSLPFVRVVEVTFPPGATSTAHSHPCPVVGYVIEGAVTTRIGDAPEAVYRAGQTFVEAAGEAHHGTANTSDSATARFLATFTCAQPQATYSTPLPGS